MESCLHNYRIPRYIYITFGWQDFFDGFSEPGTKENRRLMTFTEDMITDSTKEILAPKGFENYKVEETELGNHIWLMYFFDDCIDLITMENGVIYHVYYANFGDEIPEDDDSYYLDAIIIANNLIYPSIDTVCNYFNN